MSRKKTPDQESPETATAVAELPAAEATPAEPETPQTFAERVGQKKRIDDPDPFGVAHDPVAGVRLFDSKKDRQVAIKFDEKPNQAVIDKMKEAGYRWNPTHKIWAHPLWSDSAKSTRIDAERLYQEVRHMIREEKGIEADKEVPL